jgi:hypothetical protein
VKRKVHSAKDDLDWTVRLVWFPEAIRPIGPRQVYSGSVGTGAGFGAFGIPFSLLVFLILVIPTMLVVLPLRYAGLMSWQVQAVTYRWGRRGGPATVRNWRVRGRRDKLRKAVDEIAAALERGDEPQVVGVEADDD